MRQSRYKRRRRKVTAERGPVEVLICLFKLYFGVISAMGARSRGTYACFGMFPTPRKPVSTCWQAS
jgi:hypothetical protein